MNAGEERLQLLWTTADKWEAVIAATWKERWSRKRWVPESVAMNGGGRLEGVNFCFSARLLIWTW
jgi:hypothetical protein